MANESYTSAEKLVQEGKFFDAVQVINAGMEAFEKEVGGSGKVLKEPEEFVKEVQGKLAGDKDKVTMLHKWYELRGDTLTGLGANKRALVDYGCADSLVPGDADLKAKRQKTEGAIKEAGKKGVRPSQSKLTVKRKLPLSPSNR